MFLFYEVNIIKGGDLDFLRNDVTHSLLFRVTIVLLVISMMMKIFFLFLKFPGVTWNRIRKMEMNNKTIYKQSTDSGRGNIKGNIVSWFSYKR